MITTDIPINKIDAKDYKPLGLNVSDEAPAGLDKRAERRTQRIFHLKCKIYNSESDAFEISDARVLNYGANGLYFEAGNPFEPREPVCLFIADQILVTCNSEFGKGVHAQIVWCRRLNTSLAPKYGVGVKYFEPIETTQGG